MKHIFKIVLEGFIPSLTGGWYYDARQCHFTNTVHLYLWLALFCTPVILHLTLPFSYIIWMSYSLSVGAIFIVIKLINLRMHHLYDINKAINDEYVEEQPGIQSESHEADPEAGRVEDSTEFHEPEITDSEGDRQPTSIKYVQLEMPVETDHSGSAVAATSSGATAAAASGIASSQTPVFNLTSENDYVALLKRSQSARASSHASTQLSSDGQTLRQLKSSAEDESNVTEASLGANGGAAASPQASNTRSTAPVATLTAHRSSASRSIHRTASDCSSALQRLRAMHAELPSIHCADFIPSMRDLEALDANPRRALTTAISRSRSSSQRHRRPPSVRSIGRFLVTGTTPSTASTTAAPSCAATPAQAATGRRVQPVERSQSLRAPQGAAEAAVRTAGGERQAAAVVMPPRRTQSLRQSTERPALLPSLPQATCADGEGEAVKEKEEVKKEEKKVASNPVTLPDQSESTEEGEAGPEPPAMSESVSSSERSLISIYSWLFEQETSAISDGSSLSSGEIPDCSICGTTAPNATDSDDQIELNSGFDEQSLERLASELPSNLLRALEDSGPAERRNIIRLLHRVLREALTSTAGGAPPNDSEAGEAATVETSEPSVNAPRGPTESEIGVPSETSSSQVNEHTTLIPRQQQQQMQQQQQQQAANVSLSPRMESDLAGVSRAIDAAKDVPEGATAAVPGPPPADASECRCWRPATQPDDVRPDGAPWPSRRERHPGGSHSGRGLRRQNCMKTRGGPTGRRQSASTSAAESEARPASPGQERGCTCPHHVFLDEPVTETGGQAERGDGFEVSAFAHNHDDTSDGAVHYFQDENGDWMVYMFGDQLGTAMSWTDYMSRYPEWATASEKERALVSRRPIFSDSPMRDPYQPRRMRVPNCEVAVGRSQTRRAPTPTPVRRNSLRSLDMDSDRPDGSGPGRDEDPDRIVRVLDDDDDDDSVDAYEVSGWVQLQHRGELAHGLPGRGLPSFGRGNSADFIRTGNLRLIASDREDVETQLQRYLVNATTMNWSNRRGDSQNSIRGLAFPRGSPASRGSRTGLYKMQLIPCIKKNVKLHFGRLQLMALFDRNATVLELILSVLLAVVVGLLGGFVLNTGLYRDLSIFALCFYMAASQYSLVKSVQPDSSSPTHGFNRITVFSRAFYFILTSTLLLVTHYLLEAKINRNELLLQETPTIDLYGFSLNPQGVMMAIRTGLKHLLLMSPLLFLLGLLPQANTFCTYVLEHIDIHVFGGSGTTGLLAAFISIIKNLVVVGLGYGLCYVGVSHTEAGDSQHTVFSIYCGVHLALCYILSRSAANPSLYKDLFGPCPRTCPVQLHTEGASCVTKKSSSSVQVDDSNTAGPSWRQNNEDEPTTSEPAASTPVTDSKSASEHGSHDDPLPQQLRASVVARLKNDGVMVILITILGFAVHVSTAFTSLASLAPPAQWPIWVAVVWGAFLHYFVPHLRKTHPWKLFTKPIIKPAHSTSICEDPTPRLIAFEKVYVWLAVIERNIIIPVVVFMAMTQAVTPLKRDFGEYATPVIISICSMKLLRSGFAITSRVYLVLLFTHLAFAFDFKSLTETFLVDSFIVSIILVKAIDFVRKIQFFYVYIAPWQIAWGSAVHAFAQPFFVPHSMFLFLLAFISSVFSTPFQPFLGSAIFLTSYVRPIKFWEQDYNTKRVDNTNTALSAQLDRNTGSRSENLNAIFYEHLTRSLQHSLAGDIMLGRWGDVHHGDFFVMASDELNALVHVIEVGNGYVTFQLRGLELRGTYCQQREVEILRESVGNASQCCCCEMGDSCSCLGRHFICLNAAFQLRSLAWEVISDPYVLDGYSISDQSASHSQQVFELRKILLTLYVKCIIYYAIQSPSLTLWLNSATVQEALKALNEQGFVDLDPIFSHHLDADYDLLASGISRSSFVITYIEWIRFCVSKRDDLPEDMDKTPNSLLVSLCLALSLLGRRALSEAAHDNYAAMVDFFLYGLHALFKGDFRVTSTKDEWVFVDVDMLYKVVAPALRMGLKLHQDHFANDECLTDNEALFESIQDTITSMVICHETDSAWRYAVLNNAPRLLALRHLVEDGTEGYRIIMLTRRHLRFRMARINPECVRGLWAGQQQELVFLRNRNSERGSIQNARQVLRNMISSSCDQPLGYPIFVSPLTTSFAGTNELYSSVAFHEFSFGRALRALKNLWRRLRWRCDATCAAATSGALDDINECGIEMQSFSAGGPGVAGASASCTVGGAPSTAAGAAVGSGSAPVCRGQATRASVGATASSVGKRLQAVATLERSQSDSARDPAWRDWTLNNEAMRGPPAPPAPQRVTITDPSHIMDSRCLKVLTWPAEEQQHRNRVLLAPLTSLVQANLTGAEGTVLHKWMPCHRDIVQRSFTNKTIYLVKVNNDFVVVFEDGVVILEETSMYSCATATEKTATLSTSIA